ncbi:MAG: hypothetical protein FWG68_05145 [Defluviitaleaceae bacterium]|nr:hypothetical protein [Defluviitaleaceae bacterium]
MAKQAKSNKRKKDKNNAKPTRPNESTDNCKMIWIFDSVDNDGVFRFDPSRSDMNCADILDKILQYSKRTWADIKSEKHDNGKTKHHFLTGKGFSKAALERIDKLQIETANENIFSIRINNLTRIIGLRDGEKFITKWFDPDHNFYPTTM